MSAQGLLFDPNNLASLRGPVNTFTASFPGLIRHQPHHYYQAYVQDEWKAGGGLTLNLGLRYELDTLIWNEDRKNDGSFYPRILPLGETPPCCAWERKGAADRT